MDQKLNEGELGAYFALVTAGDLVQRAVAAQLAEHGLTPLQFSILARLLDEPGGVRMRDLASTLVHSRSGLTYQVTQLEKARLVARRASVDDERGVLAVLTDHGRDLVQKAFPGHVSLVRESLLDLLPPGGADLLGRLLEPVTAKLRG
jgi:DNA-binding MarR family transcriptional regulator